MLQTIRDKVSGWVARLLLGALVVVFVFWGINWTMSAPNYAAKVNGIEISSSEVREAYQRQLAQFERQANGAIDDVTRNQIKRHVRVAIRAPAKQSKSPQAICLYLRLERP